MVNELQQYIKGAVIKYELKVNDKYLKENILALEELKMKNGQNYMSLVSNADNAKITALGIIKLSNKGLIFSKDFNIIPFKNKLTTIIDSKVYCKKIEEAGYSPRKAIIFKGEKFEWDSLNSCPKIHEINFNANTSDYNEIIGAYAFAKDKNNNFQGILLRKSDVDILKGSSPSGNSEYSPWVKWPKAIVEAKLYRKLALEMGIDISDIDLDEKEIKEDGNFDYITFTDITVAKNQGAVSDELPINNNI
ncbi:recombinase RecT [Spiroplasma endosymbiont of Phyllotreta cruciferae]|uniref:recombinase RecT n=1 Tax=Spiroplasma endosymbiont of Phyllotreta cruciferae TaxID=2886375 RepID=UPI00209CE91D|nr:recombinase RecT [Spiroplasma endosymbiont of Phyllotreta cruciferae]